MPWGTVIVGGMLCGGVTLILTHFVTGTSSIDTAIRVGIPLAFAGIYGIILIIGFFGKR